jgi:hypothetical protein
MNSALKLRRIAAVLVIGIAALTVLLSARSKADTIDLSHYTMTFDEDFATLDVSPYGPGTRWIAHTPWNGDFGDAAFDNPGPNGPFSTSPAGLSITAHQDENGQWHAGLLCSMSASGVGPKGFAQQYGYFEMKAKLPDGPGVWPAFWLVGAAKTPASPEIDVLEYYGDFTASYRSTEHIWIKNKNGLGISQVENVPRGILSSQFNTFGVSIEPDATSYYFNRVKYWTTPTPPEFRQPLAILVNLALGGGWSIKGLKSPQVMQVQYIRVFQKKAAPGG